MAVFLCVVSHVHALNHSAGIFALSFVVIGSCLIYECLHTIYVAYIVSLTNQFFLIGLWFTLPSLLNHVQPNVHDMTKVMDATACRSAITCECKSQHLKYWSTSCVYHLRCMQREKAMAQMWPKWLHHISSITYMQTSCYSCKSHKTLGWHSEHLQNKITLN